MRNKLPRIREKIKPWGKEIWLAWTSKYAAKVLIVKKGHRYSLQYHENKEESQYIVDGTVKVTLGKMMGKVPGKLSTKILKKGQKIDVPARTIHRIEALSDTVIFEVSTPELDDVVKLADDYGRSGMGNNDLLDRKLARIKPKRQTIE